MKSNAVTILSQRSQCSACKKFGLITCGIVREGREMKLVNTEDLWGKYSHLTFSIINWERTDAMKCIHCGALYISSTRRVFGYTPITQQDIELQKLYS